MPGSVDPDHAGDVPESPWQPRGGCSGRCPPLLAAPCTADKHCLKETPLRREVVPYGNLLSFKQGFKLLGARGVNTEDDRGDFWHALPPDSGFDHRPVIAQVPRLPSRGQALVEISP